VSNPNAAQTSPAAPNGTRSAMTALNCWGVRHTQHYDCMVWMAAQVHARPMAETQRG
jgi:hypothetical protein